MLPVLQPKKCLYSDLRVCVRRGILRSFYPKVWAKGEGTDKEASQWPELWHTAGGTCYSADASLLNLEQRNSHHQVASGRSTPTATGLHCRSRVVKMPNLTLGDELNLNQQDSKQTFLLFVSALQLCIYFGISFMWINLLLNICKYISSNIYPPNLSKSLLTTVPQHFKETPNAKDFISTSLLNAFSFLVFSMNKLYPLIAILITKNLPLTAKIL